MSSDLSVSISSFLKKTEPELLEKSKQQPLLIKFSASWCGPCRKLQAEIDQLRAEQKDLLFLEIDVDKHASLAQELGITSIPALFLFHQAKIKKTNQIYQEIRAKFYQLSSVEQLKEFIKI